MNGIEASQALKDGKTVRFTKYPVVTMRKLTINGHKLPCKYCGRNAKHIIDDGIGIGVYCDRHYDTVSLLATLYEYCTSMSNEYRIY